MLIYANFSSERVLPYVYMCIHRETGEFYIGSRANKKQTLPSHLDLPRYKTSSKKVKPRFDEFDWFIVAEFFAPIDAYTFEQQMIFENWDNPLKLNDACYFSNKRLFTTIHKSYKHTAETKAKISAANTGRTLPPLTPEQCAQRSVAAHNRPPVSDATRAKISDAKRGKPMSDEHRQKLTEARRNRKPISEETRQKMIAGQQRRRAVKTT